MKKPPKRAAKVKTRLCWKDEGHFGTIRRCYKAYDHDNDYSFYITVSNLYGKQIDVVKTVWLGNTPIHTTTYISPFTLARTFKSLGLQLADIEEGMILDAANALHERAHSMGLLINSDLTHTAPTS